MKRSRAYSLGGGTLLVTAGAYLMVYAFDPFDLGPELRSPIGAAMCVAGIAAACAMIAMSVVMRRQERAAKRSRPRDDDDRPSPPGR